MAAEVEVAEQDITAFCRRWKITELLLFGSAARGELRPESDIDLLVSFAPDSDWSLLDHMAMTEQLSELLGRPVDLVSRRAVERSRNPIRREAILSSVRPYYVAR
jgi:predicted nucleotidyltransferase